jgi:hypothetical protein
MPAWFGNTRFEVTKLEMWKVLNLNGPKPDPPKPVEGKIDIDKAAQDIVRSIRQSVCGRDKK